MIKPPPYILTLNSKKSELKRVEKFVKDIFSYYDFPDGCLNKVLLCIAEATVNSIVHGNKEDYHKKVELSVDCKRHLISVTITDEGEGFDFKNLPDPTNRENILRESGRGIHIIKNMVKTFKYNKKGNSLHFQIECK